MDPLNTTKVISPATYLIAGIGLLLLGAIIGAFIDPYLPSSLSNTQKGYQTGFTAAQTLAENSPLGSMFKIPSDVRALLGTVSAIGDGNFVLHILGGNSFDDPSLIDRTIIFDTSTKVTKQVSVSLKAPQTQTKDSLPGTTTAFPVDFTDATTSASDIKVGDMVSVVASENIKAIKEFTASEVQILSKAPAL